MTSRAHDPTAPTIAQAGTQARRLRGGLRTATGGFAAELREYFQARMRLGIGFMALAGTILWVLAWIMTPSAAPSYVGAASGLIHLGGMAALTGFYVLLRCRRLSLRGLIRLDLINMAGIYATMFGIYATAYELGPLTMAAFVSLFLIARALVIPSTARRTLWYSVPAPVLFLLVQVARGQGFAWPGEHFPNDVWLGRMGWDQAVLWLGVALAVMASRLNFALRVKAYQAKQMDQYVLEGRLGQGAMGEVYRARHALMRRPTAIKVIRPEVFGPAVLQRFEHEVQQTSRLTHPNTIRIYDYGQTADGVFFYAMELLEGADLETIVERTGPLAPARVIHILMQACGALHEAHEMGLVHRDIKPGNIVLCRQGMAYDTVKVMDFGLVKDSSGQTTLTQDGELCGSPHTISPEAIQGGEITGAADLYALGAVGCFLLTAKPVFDARTVVDFALHHVKEAPVPPSERRPDVPADLERVLLDCLAKDPTDRPASAAALSAALAACRAAHAWTQQDAEAWWREHGAEVQAAQDDPPR